MATFISSYYTYKGNIYAEDADRTQTDEARKASAYVLSMIQENERACERVEKWAQDVETTSFATAYFFSAVTLDITHDPFFWFYLGAMSQPRVHHYGGGFQPVGGGCCSGVDRGGDEKACLVLLLLIAIGILVVAIIATTGLAVKHGADAEKARRKIEEVKELQREAKDRNVQRVYDHVISIRREEWVSQSIKTTFTATAAAGATLLTVSAIFALYAVVNGTAVSPYAAYIAIAGGGTVAFSLTGHVIRKIVLCGKREWDIEKLHRLYEEVVNLKVPTPYDVLANSGKENAMIWQYSKLYEKNGEAYSMAERDRSPSSDTEGFIQLQEKLS